MNSIAPAIARYLLRFLLLGFLLFIKSFISQTSISAGLGAAYPIIRSIIQFAIFFSIINLVTAALIMIYRLRKNIPYKFTDNVILGVNNLYYLMVSFGIIVMIIGFFGVNFKELLTSLSIFAAALAIIFKEYISSLINGIILSFSNELNIDDYVKIDDQTGKIIDINLQKIVLMNDDDDIIYIPNEKVLRSDIINYTKREIKKVSIDFQISTATFESIETLEKTLAASLQEFEIIIEPNSFNLKIVNVYFDHLELKFQYMLKEVNHEVERKIRKKTVRLIANLMNSQKK
jgi:small-conductance mechanosensitive channel